MTVNGKEIVFDNITLNYLEGSSDKNYIHLSGNLSSNTDEIISFTFEEGEIGSKALVHLIYIVDGDVYEYLSDSRLSGVCKDILYESNFISTTNVNNEVISGLFSGNLVSCNKTGVKILVISKGSFRARD